MRSFDIAFLRSFVAIADQGTMRQAAATVARSTAAVSQQMRALEEVAGTELFVRSAGRVVLSAAGHALLPHARRLVAFNDEAVAALRGLVPQPAALRFGMPQDFAESLLADALARFAALHPSVRVESHVERNSVLAGRYQRGELDLGLFIGSARVADAVAVARPRAIWIGAPGAPAPTDPVRLVVLEEPCLFRTLAIRSLERAGRGWTLAHVTPSVSGLWAAVSAGLGVTARLPIGLPALLGPAPGTLPPLPRVALSLRRQPGFRSPAADRLVELLADGLRHIS